MKRNWQQVMQKEMNLEPMLPPRAADCGEAKKNVQSSILQV